MEVNSGETAGPRRDVLPLPVGLSSLPRRSEVGAALLFAVVVELALPVHHVGGPAVELHLPLALGLVDVVCGRKRGDRASASRSIYWA